jgi:hypothetical protein
LATGTATRSAYPGTPNAETRSPTRNPDEDGADRAKPAVSIPAIKGESNAEWAVEIIENRDKSKTH